MALTREEREAVETLIKKVRTLENKVYNQGNLIDSLLKIVNRMELKTDMSEWTQAQWQKFLRPLLAEANSNTTIKKHSHTNEQNGGDCFAKLGANLIDEEVGA
jgi:hypothetical protein